MSKRLRKINAITQAQLIKLLWDGLYTCKELAEMTGLHYVTVLEYTRELYRFKAVHIASWEDDTRGRNTVLVYKLGPGKDAVRRKMTEAQVQQRYKDKKKAMELNQMMAGPITEASNDTFLEAA